MQAHDQAVIHGSAESNWRTPNDCFSALNKTFDFTIDAAATATDRKCHHYFGPDHEDPLLRDALQINWAEWLGPGGAPVFLNPPFSKTLLNAYNTGRIKVDGAWQPHETDRVKARAYDIASWAQKCWEESKAGCTIVGIFPFAPQTDWYRRFVYGHGSQQRAEGVGTAGFAIRNFVGWNGHAAMEEWRLPHRISFLRPDGEPAGNAGVNSAIIVWQPNPGFVGPWQPATRYWSFR